MMDIQQQGIIAIIKSALSGQKYDLPEGFNFEKAVAYAIRSQITGMVYHGAVNCNISPDSVCMQKLFSNVCVTVSVDEQQLYELSKVKKAFDESGIKYMLMKGVLLKPLYPKSYMRTMSDLDILIDENQYSVIESIMESLCYHRGIESDHELPWKKNNVYIELHKRLISTHNKDFYSYFGEGWDFASPLVEQPNRYEMSKEDVFIYLFTHLVKHYRSGGIGIKHMTDLWVYLRAYPNINMNYIKASLSSMMLLDFYNNVISTLEVWFNDAPQTEITDLITHVIFKSGAFGFYEDHLAALVIRDFKTEKRKHSRFREIRELVFPPYKKMRSKYKVLKKAPLLLPCLWIYRGCVALKPSSQKIKGFKDNINVIATDKVAIYHQSLKKVGLDFNFKE